MTERGTDDALLDGLRSVFGAVDPVPVEVTAFAHGALAFRVLDAELAELVADSADDPVTTTRSGGPGRLVTFEAEHLAIEVQVSTTGATRRLVGQLVPPATAQVTAQWPDGERDTTADELGRFTFDQVPSGPLRLRCTPASDPSVVTGWVTV